MGLLFESTCMDIVSILTALVCVLYAYVTYSFGYWSRRGVYNVPTQFPFGNTKDMILQRKNIGDTIKDLYTDLRSKGVRFGGYFVFTTPNLLIVDPELVKSIMAKDFAYFADRGTKANVEREPLTGHLLGLTGHKWKSMRQKLTPTFTTGKMKMMFQTILACADGLEEILEEYVSRKEDIDVKDVLGRFTTDIIGSCAFDLDCNSMKDTNSEFRQFGRKIFKPSTSAAIKRVLSRFLPKLFALLNLKLLNKDITEFFMKVVADTIEYREKNNIKRNDFLQLLINIKNTGDADSEVKNLMWTPHDSLVPGHRGCTQVKTGGHVLATNEGLTLEQIAAQCFIFFLAGFETSSTAMSFFLYDMSLNQDIQDKVRKEVNDMLKKHNGKLTYDGIMELQYLEMALFESMRLHSAIPVIDRRCTEDYKIPNSDVVIEKGTAITLPVYGLQSDPEYYPDPTKYDPERFSKEETAKRHPFTFLPFGEGPRVCIGQRFGLLQTKVGLVSLLRNHKYTLSKRTKVPLRMSPKNIIFQVEGGIWLKAEHV